jgi:hypothetical protein
VADIKSEQAAGFISVHMAGFTLECLAGPVGIRNLEASFHAEVPIHRPSLSCPRRYFWRRLVP